MEKQTNLGLWYWNIVWAMLIFSIANSAYGFWGNGFTEDGVRHSIRWSARAAAILFCMAFSASSIHFFWKNGFTFWLRLNRRHLGIAFAIVHLIHLFWLVVLQLDFHPIFNMAKRISLFGGGLAYVFVVLMLATSFPHFSKKTTPRNWNLLHTVGGWWIWYIFIRSYMRDVMNGDWGDLPLAVFLIVVFLFRILKRWRKSRVQTVAF